MCGSLYVCIYVCVCMSLCLCGCPSKLRQCVGLLCVMCVYKSLSVCVCLCLLLVKIFIVDIMNDIYEKFMGCVENSCKYILHCY